MRKWRDLSLPISMACLLCTAPVPAFVPGVPHVMHCAPPTAPPICAAGKDINGKDLFVGRAQKKAEREAMLRAK